MKHIETVTENQVKNIFKISLHENKNSASCNNNNGSAKSQDESTLLELQERWRNLKTIYPAVDSLAMIDLIHEEVGEENSTNENEKLLAWSESMCGETSI